MVIQQKAHRSTAKPARPFAVLFPSPLLSRTDLQGARPVCCVEPPMGWTIEVANAAPDQAGTARSGGDFPHDVRR